VKVQGNAPASLSLKEKGDMDFECSRVAAQAKLDQIVEEARSKRGSAHLVERLYEMKTGEKVKSVRLSEVQEEWTRLPRKREPSKYYVRQSRAILGRFVEFVRARNPKCQELSEVTRSLGRAFMDAEAERGIAAKTWNAEVMLLRSACRELLPDGGLNPFLGATSKAGETVFRKPFTPEEMKAILDTVKDDDFIRPIIVTGMCTALRRGDCCLLKWKDVDLERRFITVKTAKTGQTVGIPIFPLLLDELWKQADKCDLDGPKVKAEGGKPTPHPTVSPVEAETVATTRAGGLLHTVRGEEAARSESKPYPREGYVFPKQARMYVENSDGITWRVKKALAVALGGFAKADTGEQKAETALPEVPADEARRRGREFIAGLPNSVKTRHMLAVFEAYMDGKSAAKAALAAGVCKASAGAYLNEVEAAAGCRIVRGRTGGCSFVAALRSDASLLRVRRPGGVRRASVRDFHSFRVTWVTLALTAGVPLELVQKVTGHRTTDIVLKHYFQPGREDFRQALHSAMPKLLTNGHKTVKEEMRELIAIVRPVALRERLLKVWAKW